MARLLWNPHQDPDALISEWMRGVYGEAWSPMKEWFELQHRQLGDPSRHLFISDDPFQSVFSEDLLLAGDALFDKAENTATGRSSDAVAKARLSLRYLKLERSKFPGGELESFLSEARRFGVTHVAEGRPLGDWAESMRSRSR
jgi:hypothetical protein